MKLAEMQQDRYLTGLIKNGNLLEARRYLQESGHSTSDFDNLMASTVNRRLLQQYQLLPSNHLLLCRVDDQVKDFRNQTGVRLTEFEDLQQVPERGEYKATTMDEEAVIYAVKKYGQTFGLTFEMIINDDLGGFRGIIDKHARAAHRTERKQVSRYFTGNVLAYDGNNVFDAATHANAATTALATAAVETGMTAMSSQRDSTGNQLGIRPKYLVTGPALQLTAQKIVTSEYAWSNGQALTGEPNAVKGQLQPVVLEDITSPTAWFLVADPTDWPAILLAFLRGRRNPQTFRKHPNTDQAAEEGSFENDSVDYKVRHIVGSTCEDYRPLYRGNV
jgi:hypothetical protein